MPKDLAMAETQLPYVTSSGNITKALKKSHGDKGECRAPARAGYYKDCPS